MKTDWHTRKLGDVVVVEKIQSHVRDLPYVGMEDIESDTAKFIGSLESRHVKSTSFHFTPEHVLYGRLRPYLNKVLVPDFEGHCSTEIFPIRVSKDLDKKFFFYWLTSNWIVKNINATCTGTRMPRANVKAVLDFGIPLPPLPEQKRIVKKLDDVVEKVAKAMSYAEKNLQNSKELFESYLQSVFATPGKDWEKKRLGDIGKVSMCKRVFKEQTTKTGDIPFYKIGTFGKEPNAFISSKIYNEFRNKFSFPKKGDILISASGTIGRRVKYDDKPGYFQDSNIVWIDNDEKQVLNDYLYHFYGACNWNSTKGATISRLYNDNLKKIQISFPKALSEQKSIVKKLDALSVETKKLEKIYTQKLVDLEELKKSVLQQAFTGKL